MPSRYFHILDEGEHPRYKEVKIPDSVKPIAVDGYVVDMGVDLKAGWQEVSRLPDEFEHWDPKAKSFVLDVAGINSMLGSKVDKEVGNLRRQFVTDITGQQDAYKRKFDEAKAYLANEAGPFPLLTDEAAQKHMTLEALAIEVYGNGMFWSKLDDVVEAKRCGTKYAIEQASTVADKRKVAVVDWSALIAPILAGKQAYIASLAVGKQHKTSQGESK